ncbi:HemK2/MTQ2 family protein methyltransferase [Flavisolibacter ginsenosidimutans]|uniref:Methyltransferase n=1 Tax=Flavisolibacter ginsenosidimutans TaxID=661481 RepID=A0A5B8UJB3_9BACT|nr:HemK2/MTQ2 family protein methyltransferase [Flavisolibacter ginsenosidimutans]QEC56658.1 methyltransferase [Flavisolibacter ginsenosidimutans]
MRRLLKYIVGRTYKPLLVKYLSGTRTYRYKNICLEVRPEVFHPGFFFSTKFLLNYLLRLSLTNKSFLELGAGSGLISISAAQKGARVVATDINPIAVAGLKKNKRMNEVELDIIESNLFEKIPQQRFDVIAVNPPYYKKNPASVKDYAWHCGENGEFFQTFFAGLSNYVHPTSQVLMVVCDGCDREMIKQLASKNSFRLHCVATQQNLLEKNFIYSVRK